VTCCAHNEYIVVIALSPVVDLALCPEESRVSLATILETKGSARGFFLGYVTWQIYIYIYNTTLSNSSKEMYSDFNIVVHCTKSLNSINVVALELFKTICFNAIVL